MRLAWASRNCNVCACMCRRMAASFSACSGVSVGSLAAWLGSASPPSPSPSAGGGLAAGDGGLSQSRFFRTRRLRPDSALSVGVASTASVLASTAAGVGSLAATAASGSVATAAAVGSAAIATCGLGWATACARRRSMPQPLPRTREPGLSAQDAGLLLVFCPWRVCDSGVTGTDSHRGRAGGKAMGTLRRSNDQRRSPSTHRTRTCSLCLRTDRTQIPAACPRDNRLQRQPAATTLACLQLALRRHPSYFSTSRSCVTRSKTPRFCPRPLRGGVCLRAAGPKRPEPTSRQRCPRDTGQARGTDRGLGARWPDTTLPTVSTTTASRDPPRHPPQPLTNTAEVGKAYGIQEQTDGPRPQKLRLRLFHSCVGWSGQCVEK